MENEKFQELVLNHLAKLTQDLTEFKQDTASRFDRVEQKQDIANAQIAELIEFKNEATQILDGLVRDVKFLKHKEFQHEEDIFFLKDRLKIIK